MSVTIRVVPFNPGWSEQYRAAETALRAVACDNVLAIEHIGSTAVPDLPAKPVIDIMIGVRSLAIADDHCVNTIESIGYTYRPHTENEMPYRRFFRWMDAAGNRTHHLHLVAMTHDFWQSHLLFRDYLRAHPADRDAYGDLKLSLAARTWQTRGDYTDAKADLIQEILSKARDWQRRQS